MSSSKGKHLLNQLQTAVTDSLHGYVLQHSQLSLQPSLNTVISKDQLHVKVAVIAGAGSGHEPSFHGYVGRGGLAASIAGGVFASPSTGQILTVLQSLSQSYEEILCVVNNYTGDRLNFGLAVEQAKLQGIKCKLFCFGDDVAFQDNFKTGKRGLAGAAFLVKCLGALSVKKLSLDQLYERANYFASKIATMSVSLSSCDVPGSGCSFVLGPNELELGLGIHGESGVSRTTELPTSREAVNMMINALLDETKSPLRFNDDSKDVAVLINNTGGMSLLELNVIVKDTAEELHLRGLQVKRLYVGTLCSSFGMNGVSISLMQLEEEILQLIDFPCDTPIFNSCQKFTSLNEESRKFNNEDIAPINLKDADGHYLDMPGVSCSTWRQMLTAAANAIISIEDLLNSLDKVGGDGDCGLTCRKGAESLLDRLEVDPPPSLLSLVSTSNTMGGTSGAIYSLLFTSLHSSVIDLNARSSREAIESMSCREVAYFWSIALEDALNVISRYSWAEPGDRTMLDPLFCVKQTLSHVKSAQSTEDIIISVVEAAINGAQATSIMPCRAGRASYANSDSIVNSPDPGAVGVAEWVKAMAASLGYQIEK